MKTSPETNPVIPAIDAWLTLGETKGFDCAEAVLARFLPAGLARCGGVEDVPRHRRADLIRACIEETRKPERDAGAVVHLIAAPAVALTELEAG